jgi:hypothetical protein
MANLTGKTIGQLTFLPQVTNDTLFPVELSGVTYHISYSSISQNDVFVTGATYDNANTLTFTNNSGGTFDVSFNEFTGITANTISATTYENLPLDVFVTGGTFDNNSDTLTFTNNSGGTFNVSGLTDYYVTGGTLSGTTLTLRRNGLPDVLITGFTTPNILSTIDLRASQPITVTGSGAAGLSAIFTPVYVWANQSSGNNSTLTNFWNFVVPNNFSSSGSIVVDTRRNFVSNNSETSIINVFVDGVISNISSVNIFNSTNNVWETFSDNLTTPITPGQTITVTIVTTFPQNITGRTIYFRDLYFNYTI